MAIITHYIMLHCARGRTGESLGILYIKPGPAMYLMLQHTFKGLHFWSFVPLPFRPTNPTRSYTSPEGDRIVILSLNQVELKVKGKPCHEWLDPVDPLIVQIVFLRICVHILTYLIYVSVSASGKTLIEYITRARVRVCVCVCVCVCVFVWVKP